MAVEYHKNVCTILVIWQEPSALEIVDYYQYQLSGQVDSEYKQLIPPSNTMNTSVILTGILYNNSMNFSLVAHNCAGRSVEETYTFFIGK